MDKDTAAILALLVFYIIIFIVILLGWFAIRKCRGDKQDVHRYMSEREDENFDHNFTKPQSVINKMKDSSY